MASNFDKFTERARKVLFLAQEEAQRFNHPYIGPEHLLLGLVLEGEGIGAQVLTDMGLQLPDFRSTVESTIGRGEGAVIGEIGLTPRAKCVIEFTVDESRRLDSSYIGTEHLLLGLLREGGSVGPGVLESMGVSPENVRKQVMLNIDQSSRAEARNVAAEEGARPSVAPEPVAPEEERLQRELFDARWQRDLKRVREFEGELAKIRLRELDDRKKQLVSQLIAAEQRRLETDDAIRELLVELDEVQRLRKRHVGKVVRAVMAKRQRKPGQEREEGSDSEDRPSAQD